MRGRSTPSVTERFVQPATMNIDEGDDATGRLQPVTMARIENSDT
jgi:hypothetical protein